jgi:hypothetical protein
MEGTEDCAFGRRGWLGMVDGIYEERKADYV